jgi:hypothetical protein
MAEPDRRMSPGLARVIRLAFVLCIAGLVAIAVLPRSRSPDASTWHKRQWTSAHLSTIQSALV